MKKAVLLICNFFVVSLWSQNISTKLDTNQILIGDQVKWEVKLKVSPEEKVLFPILCDTCINKLEIVNRTAVDTIFEEGQMFLQQQFTLTGFDEGEYTIPSLPFFNADSVLLGETNEMFLKINTIAVDTNENIKDIKPPLKERLRLKEVLPYILYGVVGVAILFIVIYIIRKYLLKKNRSIVIDKKEKPKEPADIVALRDLEQLRQKRLWENGQLKEYYSELTDICRTYLYNRWDISAAEMVTNEIIEALEQIAIDKECIYLLKKSFEIADLVKFAKGQPIPNENITVYNQIVDFIVKTKEIIVSKEEK